MRLYLDANAIIYAIEGRGPLQAAALQHMTSVANGGQLITSLLSRLECRVLPLRQKNTALLATYDQFFTSQSLIIAELSAAVVERAAELRVKYNFKTPDALHYASAIEAKTDGFVTADQQFTRATEIPILLI